jgi:probable HAF family extracellular repeat protein
MRPGDVSPDRQFLSTVQAVFGPSSSAPPELIEAILPLRDDTLKSLLTNCAEHFLNNRGQIVGGMNVVGDQVFHPFLWDGVSLTDLGTFGGDFGSADWINEAGDVVGWALTAGNQASHAFLWRKGVLTDLGTVDGDPSSAAFVVNSGRQVVGATQDDDFAYVHAFLWERGSIADLNALIPVNSGVQLMAAVGLNERGEIVAQGVLSNGDVHAFILISCDENHPSVEGCD